MSGSASLARIDIRAALAFSYPTQIHLVRKIGMTLWDENAEILKRFAADGAQLSTERRVDFSHLFVDASSVESFSEEVRRLGFEIETSESDDEDYAWDVTVHKIIIPSCSNISHAELQLTRLAERYGGKFDGWGFFRISTNC
jgi:regulator of RNase E activity RraB